MAKDMAGRSRRVRLSLVLAAVVVGSGCTVAGSPAIAPYRSRPVAAIVVTPVVSGVADVLALAPDGALVAVADPGHGVCLRSVSTGAVRVCADLKFTAGSTTGKHATSAAFSPDGQTLAVGQDVTAQGRGSVWLVTVRSGRAKQVPFAGSGSAEPNASPTGDPTGPAYIGMVWNPVDGHLLLISTSMEKDGPASRLVDVDPQSLTPRVVAQATGPYEFQSGYLAAGGSTAVFTVFRGDQIPPNLVVIDLDTGRRKEFAALGAAGTQIVPLAVSPDGKRAIVGSATYEHSGPPHLLDLSSGGLTEIPALDGDFVSASFSPNGSQLAVLSKASDGTATIAVTSVTGGGVTVRSGAPTVPADGSRLIWSRFDVLAIDAAAPAPAASVVGWRLAF